MMNNHTDKNTENFDADNQTNADEMETLQNDDLSPTPLHDDNTGAQNVDTGETETSAAAQLDTDDAKVIMLAKQLDQAKEQTMRALADAENTRKRALKEREDIRKYAVADFAKDMLDFADNFRRALDSIPEDLRTNEKVGGIVTGVESMEKDLLKTFDRHGIKKLDPMDEIFNPNFHEVMFETPMPGKPAGMIIQVLEPGYTVHDRLLRPARVGVVKDDGQARPEGGTTIDQSA